MIRVAFVCHGNICRSPLAEFLFKDKIQKLGELGIFYAESFGTSGEELNNPIYPPVRAILSKRGISFEGKRAQKITVKDYDRFDYFLCMEEYNKRNLLRIFGNDREGKVYKLLDFTGGGDVSDPYYYGGFDKVEEEIEKGVDALIKSLLKTK